MRVLSVDIGVIHLGLVVMHVDDEDMLGNAAVIDMRVEQAHLIDITRYTHATLSRATCALPHTRDISDRLVHALADYEPLLGPLDLVLVEQQPPGGFTQIESLIFQRYRSKCEKVSPVRMHQFFGLSDDYDTRKAETVALAAPFMRHLESFAAAAHHECYRSAQRDRNAAPTKTAYGCQHDLADACVLAAFHLVQMRDRMRADATAAWARAVLERDMQALHHMSVDAFFEQFRCPVK